MIEFAQRDGVAAAARKARRSRAGALPGSVCVQFSSQSCVFVRGQPVDIQERFPLRIWLAKFRKRRSPPEAARIFGILPEIVEQPAAPRDIGNVVRPVVDRRQRVAIRRKWPRRRTYPASADSAVRRNRARARLRFPPARDRDRHRGRRWSAGRRRAWLELHGRLSGMPKYGRIGEP